MFKKLICAILLLSVFSGVFLSACNREQPEPDRIDTGFSNNVRFMKSIFSIDAKTETLIFDIDNIEIDFYFGYFTEYLKNDGRDYLNESVGLTLPEGCDWGAVVAYFYNKNEPNYGRFEDEYSDYFNIENLYILKEFSIEEFFTEKFAVVYTKPSYWGVVNFTYSYYETFTVPKEILIFRNSINNDNSPPGVSFYFAVRVLLRSEESGEYFFDTRSGTGGSSIGFYIEDIGDGKIKIKIN